MTKIHKILKHVFMVAFAANVWVFCTAIILSNYELMALSGFCVPLCLWGIDLHSDK